MSKGKQKRNLLILIKKRKFKVSTNIINIIIRDVKIVHPTHFDWTNHLINLCWQGWTSINKSFLYVLKN